MKHSYCITLLLAMMTTGCAVHQPNIAMLSSGLSVPDDVTVKQGLRAANLGLQAATGTGLGLGVAAGQLLNTGDYQKTAAKFNHLEVWMPVSEAKRPDEAKFKMSKLLEEAVRNTILAPYQSKLYEYENIAVFGAVDKHRGIRIDGPGCEAWSCIAYVSIPTPTSVTGKKGDMVKYDHPVSKGHIQCPCWVYDEMGGGIAFAKITKEFDEKGSGSGQWHRIESKPADFSNEDFYSLLSRNLPDWAYLYIAVQPGMEVPAFFNAGFRIN